MKKTISTIVLTFIATVILVVTSLGLYGYYILQNIQPDYTKVLTEEEINKVLDDSISALGGAATEKEHTDDGTFNSYIASFNADGLDIQINLDDMTNWGKETMETFTGDPDVTWDQYISKSYNKMVELFAEADNHNSTTYYEDDNYLTKLKDYDVEVDKFKPTEDRPTYSEAANTVIGNYLIRVMTTNEDQSAVLNSSLPRLEIFMGNLLKALKS
ncbi:hypothetical protein KJ632_04715 [Patescibacteria group bacterium]|nr:hypothetical protein [Patescibacteria group bacterium]